MEEAVLNSILGVNRGNKIVVSSKIKGGPTTKGIKASNSESVYHMIDKIVEANF